MGEVHSRTAGESSVDLRLLVDRSSVESFAMAVPANGTSRSSSAFYRAAVALAVVPQCTENAFARDKCASSEGSSGVRIWSTTGAKLGGITAHEMGCAWIK